MTTKLYDQDSHCRTFSAQVLSCTPVQGGQWHIVLDQTAFFPEGGGQPGDQGALDTVRVLDTRERGDAIVHITDGPLTPGTSVTGELDWALRFARMPLRGACALRPGPQPLRLHQRGLPHGGGPGDSGL